MSLFGRLIKAKVIFIAYDFNPSGGSCVSANHYYHYWTSKGELVERFSRDSKFGFIKILLACIFGKRLVFNGLYCFYFYDLALLCAIRRDSILYLHESEYAIQAFEKHSTLKFSLFKSVIKRHKVACISTLQQEYIQSRFGAVRTSLVYNTIPFIKEIDARPGAVNIMMVGYLMQRKGVDFYSKLADYAKEKKEKWDFFWMGGHGGEYKSLYFSENVKWLGLQTSPHYYYEKMDLFFLSSVDEPMGLVCAEALMHHKKCVLYKNTGFAELVRDVEGCCIYNDYSIESAYDAIKKAISSSLNVNKVDRILNDYLSVEAFSKRLDQFVFNSL